jgi:hypothetical protein
MIGQGGGNGNGCSCGGGGDDSHDDKDWKLVTNYLYK